MSKCSVHTSGFKDFRCQAIVLSKNTDNHPRCPRDHTRCCQINLSCLIHCCVPAIPDKMAGTDGSSWLDLGGGGGGVIGDTVSGPSQVSQLLLSKFEGFFKLSSICCTCMCMCMSNLNLIFFIYLFNQIMWSCLAKSLLNRKSIHVYI